MGGDAVCVVWDCGINAALQRCLRRHGELHNNLRMTWGKAFLSWAPSPGSALAWALELNHKYALDGGDPCSYGGVLWCFGGFDGPKVRLRVLRDVSMMMRRATFSPRLLTGHPLLLYLLVSVPLTHHPSTHCMRTHCLINQRADRGTRARA